jgi:hypothetical protein
MRQLLRGAEDAAAVAAAECEGLVGVVQALIDQESRVRNAHAHRALELREALQQTHAALRRAAKDRVAQNEVSMHRKAPSQSREPRKPVTSGMLMILITITDHSYRRLQPLQGVLADA